jgi:ribosomal protein L29
MATADQPRSSGTARQVRRHPAIVLTAARETRLEHGLK